MSELIIVIGESGTGKSTSLRNLKAGETIVINVGGKKMPFRGGDKKFGKNILHTTNSGKICSWLEKIKAKKEIKNIVIDDFQYIASFELLSRANEKGYDKFTQIAHNVFMPLKEATSLRDDQKTIILMHSETDENGRTRAKTVGKMISNILNLESLATVVLYTEINDDGYFFRTQNNKNNTGKSPLGMFPEPLIENDLVEVIKKIDEYYEED